MLVNCEHTHLEILNSSQNLKIKEDGLGSRIDKSVPFVTSVGCGSDVNFGSTKGQLLRSHFLEPENIIRPPHGALFAYKKCTSFYACTYVRSCRGAWHRLSPENYCGAYVEKTKWARFVLRC